MTKTILAGVAALLVFSALEVHARNVTTTCEGKVGWHSLRAYTAIIKDYGKAEVENECIFVTRSRIGAKILKVCPRDSRCSIEADVETVSGEYEIERIISIKRIGTPALAAQAQQECSGILHKDKNGLLFGGGRGEGEGICIINNSEESKVLATCSPGQFCRVKGAVKDCEDSGECGELTHVTSVRRR